MSVAAFVLAYAVDWLIGDPEWLPHPVRWMGGIIKRGDELLRRGLQTSGWQFIRGVLLTCVVVVGFGAGSWLFLRWLSSTSATTWFVVSILLAASTLATRSLLKEAINVRRLLLIGDLPAARHQVGRIVGRDTENLDKSEITRATIETLAESASDGIVAPLLYLTLGGVPLALAYKAVNTLDSMIGHRDERYEHFGKFAARLDDVANFLPARITALLIVIASRLMRLDPSSAWRILVRDGYKHKSPNAGRPEAAMAGALGVRLGGTNFYDGIQHDGQYLGDELKPLDDRAFRDALRLTLTVSVLMFLVCLLAQISMRLFEGFLNAN